MNTRTLALVELPIVAALTVTLAATTILSFLEAPTPATIGAGQTAAAAEARSYYPSDLPRLARGDFIFFSNSVIPVPTDTKATAERRAQLDYIKQFRVCLTNGYKNFEGQDLEELQKAGCELFIYRWFDGFYECELPNATATAQQIEYFSDYPEILAAHAETLKHKDWFLNPDKVMQGGGAEHPAYFFDFTNSELRRFLIERIEHDLKQAHYSGVFFDYIGGWALPDEVKAISRQKHPDMPFDRAGLVFLKELRAAIPEAKIFGNQAYRLGEDYYDVIDYDATESHHTSFVWGQDVELYLEGKGTQKLTDTFYRTWDAYQTVSQERRGIRGKKPRVQVFDINYLQPLRVPTGRFMESGDQRVPVFADRTDRPAIFYSYAMSKLENGYPYASDWYAEGYGRDDVYFLDLDATLNEDYIEAEEVVVRYFKNGFVVVTRSNSLTTFAPDAQYLPQTTHGVWDVFEGTPVFDWESKKQVSLIPTYYPSTQSYYPAGRVFMYFTPPVP